MASNVPKRPVSAVTQLLNSFRNKYAKAVSPDKLNSKQRKLEFKHELQDYYNNEDPDNPWYYNELVPLRYENTLRHVIKNHSQLTNTSNSIFQDHDRKICEKQHAIFQAETELKSRVMRAIMVIQKFESFSSEFKNKDTKSRRLLLSRGETEIQVVLKEAKSQTSSTSHLQDLWKDPFHPINLSFNFDCFRTYTNLLIEQKKNSSDKWSSTTTIHDENTFKRHYLRYMHKIAESNQEFLLAVISVLGTDVRFYPSKILEFFQERKMLKNEFNQNLPGSPGIRFVFNDSEDLIRRNSEYLKKLVTNPVASKKTPEPSFSSVTDSEAKPLIQIVKLIDLTEDVDMETLSTRRVKGDTPKSTKDAEGTKKSSTRNGGSTSSKAKSSDVSSKKTDKESSSFLSTKKPLHISVSGVVRTVTQEVKQKDPLVETVTSKKSLAIPLEQFRDSTQKLWQMFFEPGFKLSPSIATNWYQLYVNHVITYKEQINNCIDCLLQDRKRSCYYDIPRLHPAMILGIRQDLSGLEASRRSATSFNMSTVEGIMHSQTTSLQLALQDSTKNKSVPSAMSWSPTNIQMPYQAFEGHLDWRLAEIGKALDGLSIEMIKLRYAEYLSLAFTSDAKQFILGVFTAYGPDLYSYPTRVLQLLKKKQVVRTGTRLHSMIQMPVDGRQYTALVPMKASEHAASIPCIDSSINTPLPFNLPMIEPGVPIPQTQVPSAPVRPIQPLMEVQPQFGTNHLQPPTSLHQFSFDDQRQHPLDDFPRSIPNSYQQDTEQEYYGAQFQQQSVSQLPESPFMNHLTSNQLAPQPQMINPAVNNFNNSMQPLMHQQSQDPLKSMVLPSVLTVEAWKAACERSLIKYGAKYGISPLSDQDYKVLYDRYLFDTFENSDDFVRGILTGISLARYPRDNEDPVNTNGLLNLRTSKQSTDVTKHILKPILKASPQPAPASQPAKKSVTMSREDLLRISSLIDKLIPDATVESSSQSQDRTTSSTHLVDYKHQASREANAIPIRRNYDEEERGFEYHDRMPVDYDRRIGTISSPFEFSRRPMSRQPFENNMSVAPFNPIKRPADYGDDLYESLLHKRPKPPNTTNYNYK